jgi:hypothetical protein
MIADDVAKQNYRFSAVVLAIAKSTPFQMKKAMDEAPQGTLVASH